MIRKINNFVRIHALLEKNPVLVLIRHKQALFWTDFKAKLNYFYEKLKS